MMLGSVLVSYRDKKKHTAHFLRFQCQWSKWKNFVPIRKRSACRFEDFKTHHLFVGVTAFQTWVHGERFWCFFSVLDKQAVKHSLCQRRREKEWKRKERTQKGKEGGIWSYSQHQSWRLEVVTGTGKYFPRIFHYVHNITHHRLQSWRRCSCCLIGMRTEFYLSKNCSLSWSQ